MNKDDKKGRLWNVITGYETDDEMKQRKRWELYAGLLVLLLLFVTPFVLMVVYGVGIYVVFGFIASVFGIDFQ